MLGPSVMYAGTPLALIVSAIAVGRGIDRKFAVSALALSATEALLLAAVIAISLWGD